MNEVVDAPVQSLLQSCNAVENQKEVGIWTNSSNKTEKTTSKIVPANPSPFTRKFFVSKSVFTNLSVFIHFSIFYF